MNSKVSPCTFLVTGLTSATLCQKDQRRIIDVIEDWNEKYKEASSIKVELSVNHYSPKAPPGIDHRVLLIIELSATWPKNHKRNFIHYDLIFSAGDGKDGTSSVPWFNTPIRTMPIKISESRSSAFTLIAADKLSVVPSELYSLRRRVLTSSREKIAVYGMLWGASFSQRIKILLKEIWICTKAGFVPRLNRSISFLFRRIASEGPIEKKYEAYGKAKFSLVIENSLELRTEKLFDALEAGTLPVYVGPSVDDGIPTDLYVSARANVKDVLDAMADAKNRNFGEWSNLRETWMMTESYKRTSNERFEDFLHLVTTRINQL